MLQGVRLNKHAVISDYDLMEIGDNVGIDHAHITPFCLAPGKMGLKPIRIGNNCIVCLKSTLVGGHSLADGE